LLLGVYLGLPAGSKFHHSGWGAIMAHLDAWDLQPRWAAVSKLVSERIDRITVIEMIEIDIACSKEMSGQKLLCCFWVISKEECLVLSPSSHFAPRLFCFGLPITNLCLI
jgi:hypothetical protein